MGDKEITTVAATADVVTDVAVTIPRPMVPDVLTTQDLQNKSMYKSMRRTITAIETATSTPLPPPIGSISFGTVATNASDGKPGTFTKAQMDCVMLRVLPAGSSVTGVPNMWVAGGGDTDIKHGLGRVPIGYYPVRTSQGVAVSDGTGAWTATDIYFKVDHSDTDVTLVIF